MVWEFGFCDGGMSRNLNRHYMTCLIFFTQLWVVPQDEFNMFLPDVFLALQQGICLRHFGSPRNLSVLHRQYLTESRSSCGSPDFLN